MGKYGTCAVQEIDLTAYGFSEEALDTCIAVAYAYVGVKSDADVGRYGVSFYADIKFLDKNGAQIRNTTVYEGDGNATPWTEADTAVLVPRNARTAVITLSGSSNEDLTADGPCFDDVYLYITQGAIVQEESVGLGSISATTDEDGIIWLTATPGEGCMFLNWHIYDTEPLFDNPAKYRNTRHVAFFARVIRNVNTALDGDVIEGMTMPKLRVLNDNEVEEQEPVWSIYDKENDDLIEIDDDAVAEPGKTYALKFSLYEKDEYVLPECSDSVTLNATPKADLAECKLYREYNCTLFYRAAKAVETVAITSGDSDSMAATTKTGEASLSIEKNAAGDRFTIELADKEEQRYAFTADTKMEIDGETATLHTAEEYGMMVESGQELTSDWYVYLKDSHHMAGVKKAEQPNATARPSAGRGEQGAAYDLTGRRLTRDARGLRIEDGKLRIGK